MGKLHTHSPILHEKIIERIDLILDTQSRQGVIAYPSTNNGGLAKVTRGNLHQYVGEAYIVIDLLIQQYIIKNSRHIYHCAHFVPLFPIRHLLRRIHMFQATKAKYLLTLF